MVHLLTSKRWSDAAADGALQDFATPPESPTLGASCLSGTSLPTVITAQTLHMAAALLPSAQLHRLVEPGVQLTWNNQLDTAHTALATGAAYSPRHALHLAEVRQGPACGSYMIPGAQSSAAAPMEMRVGTM